MKTLLLILLTAALCVVLFGCGGSDPSDDGTPDAGMLPVTCAPAGCAK